MALLLSRSSQRGETPQLLMKRSRSLSSPPGYSSRHHPRKAAMTRFPHARTFCKTPVCPGKRLRVLVLDAHLSCRPEDIATHRQSKTFPSPPPSLQNRSSAIFFLLGSSQNAHNSAIFARFRSRLPYMTHYPFHPAAICPFQKIDKGEPPDLLLVGPGSANFTRQSIFLLAAVGRCTFCGTAAVITRDSGLLISDQARNAFLAIGLARSGQ